MNAATNTAKAVGRMEAAVSSLMRAAGLLQQARRQAAVTGLPGCEERLTAAQEALGVAADEIMGVRAKPGAFGSAPLEGVQFHPESFLTTEGPRLLASFLGLTYRAAEAASPR